MDTDRFNGISRLVGRHRLSLRKALVQGGAKPLYDAIVAPKEYILFTNAEGAGEHDEAGAPALFAQRVFDWLDETLAKMA